ncbi:hypothetical protein HELRODRAFT_178465 [Helobdella robusta]|uniref:ubiquitinyl hydrolase 1 n=1 Tax=Helobdella robusta TaxID=6412 RepID=T1FD73_HELRO|nr:hypothetical protein HELRODRAFT_178465 [Helobdella robusta]ESN97022.1 hypothetical protein HELRODRAFT_178465 [Helobdella robusta]
MSLEFVYSEKGKRKLIDSEIWFPKSDFKYTWSFETNSICDRASNFEQCFMNCVLQCLANTYPLLQLCLNYDLNNQINTETSRMRGSLVRAYVDLTHSMWKGMDTFSPTTFKQEVSRFAKLFAGYNQQDAQEFLMYLLQDKSMNNSETKKRKWILVSSATL